METLNKQLLEEIQDLKKQNLEHTDIVLYKLLKIENIVKNIDSSKYLFSNKYIKIAILVLIFTLTIILLIISFDKLQDIKL